MVLNVMANASQLVVLDVLQFVGTVAMMGVIPHALSVVLVF